MPGSTPVYYGQPQAQPNGQFQTGGQYSGQFMASAGQPVQGPDMGQPHFSAQIPGAAPYQGAPAAPVYGQPQAGFYAMGEQRTGQPQAPATGGYYGNGTVGWPQLQPPGPSAWPAYQPGGMYAPPAVQQMPNPGQAQGYENRYGELYGLINEAAAGNPDVSKFLNFFEKTSSDFWKGALLGAGMTFLLTNDRVKGAIAGVFSGVCGAFGKNAEEMEKEEDRKAEKKHAKKEKE
ncbi:MAG: hypothetical protein EOM25_13885 [Deltaproteobacteria bacterium]|nr:hypothetical protein [Deltaproteobacteria bacterium]